MVLGFAGSPVRRWSPSREVAARAGESLISCGMADAPLSLPLERIIQQFSGLVLSIGRRAGLADADLDELVQSVRLRLWRTRGEMVDGSTVSSSYMHHTAKSAAIDIVRARRSRMASASDPIEPMALVDGTLPPDRAIEARELADAVAAVVDGLSADRRTAVKLYLAGYGRHEIAELLGWSDDRTRNLIHRGMADLRARLSSRGFAPSGDR